jgi:hypothetical protein
MFKVPDDPVPKSKVVRFGVSAKQRVEQEVQRDQLSMAVDVVSDLPANAAPRARHPQAFLDDRPLELEVILDCQVVLVLLTHVIWWRRDN